MAEEQKDESKEQLAKSLAFLKVGAKNFLHLKGIARDLNVASQNIQLLLKAVGGEPRKSGQTDMHILTPDQIDKKLEVDVTKASLITGEEKSPSVVGTALKAAAISKFKKSAIGKKAIQFSSKLGLAKIIPRIIGLFTKIAFAKVYAVLLGLSIVKLLVDIFWKNIVSAFDSFTESVSDIYKTIVNGAGKILDSIKNLFSKETLDNIITNVAEFFKPVTDVFKNIYDKVYKFVLEKVNDIKKFFGIPIEIKKDTPKPIGEGVEIEGRKKAKEEAEKAKEKKEKPAEKPAPAKPAEKPAEKPAPAPAKPTPTPAPAAAAPTPSPAPGKADKKKKPSATEDMTGKAKEVGKAIEEAGITSPSAIQALVATAAKESGLDPKSKELGASDWLATLSGRGISYIHNKFPQLGPNGRVAKSLGMPEGVSADYLKSAWSKGDEAFFEMVYGGSGTNPQPGDGYKFRGRGFIQITGRNVYKNVGKAVGENFESSPDAVSSDFGAAAKAMVGYIVNSVGQGNSKKGFDFLNSLTDFKTALKVIIGNVAMGSLGSNMEKVEAAYTTSKLAATNVGQLEAASKYENIAKGSTDVAAGQRQQAKPSAPVIINASTTNNTKVQKNETVAVNKPQNTAGMLAARTT